MTHRLRSRDPKSPWLNPLVVSLRYRCECAANEVLQIQCVLDIDVPEWQFLETMKQLRRDVLFEVEQHVDTRNHERHVSPKPESL